MIPKNTAYIKWQDILLSLFAAKDETELLEKDFCRLTKRVYALALPYNRMGIYLFCLANNWKNKDILMPAYTCVVVAEAVICSGNKPIFVDIDPLTYNLDLADIKRKLTANTAAVIPTHMYGCPIDIKELRNILPESIFILEDAALSVPGYDYGRGNEMISDIMIYSLGHNKIITSIEGGLAVFKEYALYEKIKNCQEALLKKPSFYRNFKIILKSAAYKFFSQPFLYGGVDYLRNKFPLVADSINSFTLKKIELPGDWRSRFSGIQAALARRQLKRLDEIIAKRKKIDNLYFARLKDASDKIILPKLVDFPYSHFTIRVKDRDKLGFREKLRSLGIEAGRTLDYCLPEMELFSVCRQKNTCPSAVLAAKEIVNLPNYPSLTERQAEFIARSVIGLL